MGKFSYLANKALKLGLVGTDSTRGHVLQACGGIQKFYQSNSADRAVVRKKSPTKPYRLTGTVLADWNRFFQGKTGPYERTDLGYDWDHLRTYLTPDYGGTVSGGGGGKNEFEIVFRLLAEPSFY